MGAGGVEVEPKDITWRRPVVVVRLDHDSGLYPGQRKCQSPDFL